MALCVAQRNDFKSWNSSILLMVASSTALVDVNPLWPCCWYYSQIIFNISDGWIHGEFVSGSSRVLINFLHLWTDRITRGVSEWPHVPFLALSTPKPAHALVHNRIDLSLLSGLFWFGEQLAEGDGGQQRIGPAADCDKYALWRSLWQFVVLLPLLLQKHLQWEYSSGKDVHCLRRKAKSITK